MTTSLTNLLLLAVLLTNLYLLTSSRLYVAIRGVAFQGVALAMLPFALAAHPDGGGVLGLSFAALVVVVMTLAVKAALIPALLRRAMRIAKVKREVEPLISLRTSMFLGAALTGIAFWIGTSLELPGDMGTSSLVVPVALATVFAGFLMIVTRRKAITQVIGYLALENGIYVFGLCLAREMPFLVELGLLLDLLVGVFVMGIAIHHISREFEAIDTDALATLRD